MRIITTCMNWLTLRYWMTYLSFPSKLQMAKLCRQKSFISMPMAWRTSKDCEVWRMALCTLDRRERLLMRTQWWCHTVTMFLNLRTSTPYSVRDTSQSTTTIVSSKQDTCLPTITIFISYLSVCVLYRDQQVLIEGLRDGFRHLLTNPKRPHHWKWLALLYWQGFELPSSHWQATHRWKLRQWEHVQRELSVCETQQLEWQCFFSEQQQSFNLEHQH